MAQPSPFSLLARAFSVPPMEALEGVRRVAVLGLHGAGQRLGDLIGRGAPGAEAAAWDPFGAEVVLPLVWPERGPDPAKAESARANPDLAGPGPVGPDSSLAGAVSAPTEAELQAIRAAARDALDHRFDLLGSGPVRVGYGLRATGLAGHRYDMAPGAGAEARQRSRMTELLPSLVGTLDDYRPIDWHVDFKSGFRWDPDRWFRSIRYGQRPGVDVKVPWELSRFQHVGALGLAGRLASGTPEGDAAAAELVRQVVDWIAANPVRRGVNWTTAMDVALRALSWLAGVALVPEAVRGHPGFAALLYRSLVEHGRHIEANLEYDPRRGNHYLSDVLGLVAIGAALPGHRDADRWLCWGLQELESEIRRQVRRDGMDFEGSTTYHGLVAELFTVGAAIATRVPGSRRRRLADVRPGAMAHPLAPPIRPPDEQPFDPGRPALLSPGLFARLRAMAELTAEVTKPNGLVPQVGDVDSGRVLALGARPDPRDWQMLPAVVGRLLGDPALEAAGEAHRLQGVLLAPEWGRAGSAGGGAAVDGSGVRGSGKYGSGVIREAADGASLAVFPASGIAVGRADGLHLLTHAGLVAAGGPSAHFHNDLLSFELSWDGADIVVDPGTFVYTPLPDARDAYRATAAHSTVYVEGREQRLWPPRAAGLFTIRDDADSVVLEPLAADRLRASCAYGEVRHEREWRWSDRRVQVVDTVESPAPAAAVLNLAPGIAPDGEPEPAREGWSLTLQTGAGAVRLEWVGVDRPEVGPGRYSVGYGRARPCLRLEARLTGSVARLVLERERPAPGEDDAA